MLGGAGDAGLGEFVRRTRRAFINQVAKPNPRPVEYGKRLMPGSGFGGAPLS
jgi:hypothetical protein